MLTLKTDCHILCSPCFVEKAVSAYAFPIDWLQIIIATNKNSEISSHPTIVNDIPLYSHNFYRSLYDVVCDVFFLLFKPRCAYFWMLFLLGPALKLWLDRETYTVERLIQPCYDVCITVSGCPYYLGAHIKLALWRKVTDTWFIWYIA